MSGAESNVVAGTNSSSGGPVAGVWCVVVAGGSGTRFGSLKQFESLSGTPVIVRSAMTAAEVCEGVVVVVPSGIIGTYEAIIEGATAVVAGGSTRAESVRAGLAAIPDSARFVLVHDGARPLASIPLYRRVIDALEAGADAVIPVVPVADTLRSLHGDPVDRDSVRAVQTPQGFRAGVLREAHAGGGDATDDAALVELLGYQVSLVDGERSNLKLTERVDLLVAAAMIDSPAPDDSAPDSPAPGDSARGDTAPGDSAPDDTDRKGAAENFASGSRFEPDDTDSDSQ